MSSDNDESLVSKSVKDSSSTNPAATPLILGFTKEASRTEPIASPGLPAQPPSLSYNSKTPRIDGLLAGHADAPGIPETRAVIIQQRNPHLDVYAKSYVPTTLRAINDEMPGNVLITETRQKIDFGAYITGFAGRDFLACRPKLGQGWLDVDSLPATELTERSYVRHFASLIQHECAAKEHENEQHALYRVPLYPLPTHNVTQLWALVVPGLREDSPFIEMGDILQIRQLWVDRAGNQTQMPTTIIDNGQHRIVYRLWTGIQYDASVHSISRVRETVYLRVDGLEHLRANYDSNILPMIVNIVIPLKQKALQGQYLALWSIGRSLGDVSESEGKARVHLNGDTPSSANNEAVSGPTTPVHHFRNDWIRRMLFPIESDGQPQTRLRNMPHRALFDHAINYEQAHAVNSICAINYGTLPYLISGPPGTGKTKTLVEAAMQLLNTTEVAHLLVCAPSEAAADTLALRLTKYLSPKQLFRLNRPNRADNEVPRELLQYCYIQDDMFYLPTFKTVLSYSVVVTSCRDAAILAEARLTNVDLWTLEHDLVAALHPEDEPPMPSLHWGALLLDEAAQATEIDALPAINVICPPSALPQDHTQPRLVMAGDEHQLGPRTASHDPAFSTSLFARLFARTVYASHPLSRSSVKPSAGPPVLKRSMLPMLYPPFTNLIRNYRSHPAILSIPSSLFYHDTLIPEAPLANTPLQTSSLWRGRKWPVLYIPHTGADEIERENGGWYNVSEARLASSLVQTLVFECGVAQADICIMSPFAAQVKLLRSLVRNQQHARGTGLWDVDIGPVEAFQGLEKRVVILCTTRTRSRFVQDDVNRGMGLMQQRRKMNVALTRAKQALFVIGSPEVMKMDPHWRAWMAFCDRNGLVDDRMGVWKDGESFGECKIGVLERALIAKEDGMRDKKWPALGAAAADYDVDGGGEYEAWIESLRQALNEDVDGHDGDEEEQDHDYEEEEDTIY